MKVLIKTDEGEILSDVAVKQYRLFLNQGLYILSFFLKETPLTDIFPITRLSCTLMTDEQEVIKRYDDLIFRSAYYYDVPMDEIIGELEFMIQKD